MQHLIVEYQQTANQLQQHLLHLKELRETAPPQESLLLDRRILLLQEELRDTRKILDYLSERYKPVEEGEKDV